MAEVVLTKEEKQWLKQLNTHLESYLSLRDWSQLAAWLAKLKNQFSDKKGPVHDKNSLQTLLKRLATSLNGALPVALHEATLQIYEMLFQQSIISGEQLHIACIGVFSYYSQANVKNKIRTVELLAKHFPKFGTDIQLLATGLTITLLPSLNEMHQPLIREVTTFLDCLAKPELVGQQSLSEAVWVAVLRSGSCRVAGLKYVSSKLGRGYQQEQNDEEDNFWNEPSSIVKKKHEEVGEQNTSKKIEVDFRELLKDFCPRIETLVINAIIMCIQDSNLLAIKSGLDFLYKYLPLRSDVLKDQGKMRLTKCVVWLLARRDTSVTRKINLWLFGKPDDQNKYNIHEKQLNYAIDSLIGFLQSDSQIEPLKIAFNLLTQHEQMPKMVLAQLTPHLLLFCKQQQANPQVMKTVHRLIERLHLHLHIVSESLSQGLFRAIADNDYQEAQKLLNLAVFFLSKILKPEEQKRHLKPFLDMLLQSSLRTKWANYQFSRLAIKQSLQLIQKYREPLKETPLTTHEEQLLGEHVKLYAELVDRARAKELQGQEVEQEIWLISRLLVKAEEMFQVFSQEWVNTLLDNLALGSPQHFLSPIQVIGETLEREGALKKAILIRSEDTSKNNCIRVSLSKLWGILSLGHLQAKVIPLLLRIVKHFPHFFERLLESQFDQNGQLAIIKFRLFWEVTPKHPHIVSADQVQECTKYGLFRMLQFLDSGNPLVKYHSHLWISEAYYSYHRVLNPILQIMLQHKNCWYRTPQGQFIYAVEPQKHRIIQSLKYLKSLVRLVPQKFNKYAFKPLTPKILPYYRLFRGEDPGNNQLQEVPYIYPLLELVVRFTQSKFAGGDNYGIDLHACELLQAIAKATSTYQLSNYILKNHFRSILRSLHFATVNDEHLLQIQLLSLLQLLLVNSNVKKLSDGTILSEIVTHQSFSSTILEGVGSSFPYIKQRFVWFLNQCIPLILERHSNCSEVVSRIFNTYTNKIAYVNSKKVEATSLKDLQISQKNAQILILFEGVKDLLSQFLNLHLQPFDKQKTQHDTDSGLFSFYSYKAFIHLKIERKPASSRNRKIIQEQFITQLPQLLAIMAECWVSSELRNTYGLTRQGLPVFDYERFLTYNRSLEIAQSKLQVQETVENYLVNLLRILLNTYRNQTMRALVKCWADAVKDPQSRIKLLQLLIFSALPLEHFFSMLSQAMAPQKTGRKRRPGTLQFQLSSQQDVLQLCLALSQYSFQNVSLFQSHNLINIWLSFLRFVKLFENTRSVLTLFHLVELIDLFMSKNNPKEIMRDEKIKKEWAFIGMIFSELIAVCCGKLRVDVGTLKVIKYNDILPLPSSAYQALLAWQKEQVVGEQQPPHPFLSNWEEVPAARGLYQLRLTGLVIARRVSYNLLQNLYYDSEITLVKKAREVVQNILPLVEDKEQKDLMVEGASELILCLLEKKAIFVKEVKNQILHIFNKEDFFICSSKTLQNWAKIIDLLIDHNKDHDIFKQYLEKVSLASSLFSSYTFQTKKKIKSFQRICFILYAGKKDKYTDKAQQLVDKIIEVTKNTEAPQPVLILIFFCIRILILRTSAQRLTKLLSTIWQNIIFLLAKTFNTSAVQNQLNQHWAALKLIEMISLMQIAEFHPHQWVFFYDFVGVRFSNNPPESAKEIKLSIYPKIHQFLPNGVRLVKEEGVNLEEKRHLIIKEDKIDDLQLLKTKALLLSSYLVASNGCRMHFDMKEVEQLIDNDFLNLDEFIFKV